MIGEVEKLPGKEEIEGKRKELVRTAVLLFERGLVSGADGNISLRLSGGRMLITPSGAGKGMLSPGQLLVQKFDGEVVEGEGRPTKEARMHSRIYEKRPEVKAIIHTHPPAATAFAVCGRTLPSNCLVEVGAVLGKMGLAPYEPAGSEELSAAVEAAAAEHDIIFLKNHGIITCAETMEKAFLQMDAVENAAKTIIYANIIGDIQTY